MLKKVKISGQSSVLAAKRIGTTTLVFYVRSYGRMEEFN